MAKIDEKAIPHMVEMAMEFGKLDPVTQKTMVAAAALAEAITEAKKGEKNEEDN